MDHIVPISRGGRTTKGNVVPCCKECNNAKKQLLAMEWEHYLMQLKHP
jgi:5-methylcytosine-specific restriction endonuclease McrA